MGIEKNDIQAGKLSKRKSTLRRHTKHAVLRSESTDLLEMYELNLIIFVNALMKSIGMEKLEGWMLLSHSFWR